MINPPPLPFCRVIFVNTRSAVYWAKMHLNGEHWDVSCEHKDMRYEARRQNEPTAATPSVFDFFRLRFLQYTVTFHGHTVATFKSTQELYNMLHTVKCVTAARRHGASTRSDFVRRPAAGTPS